MLAGKLANHVALIIKKLQHGFSVRLDCKQDSDFAVTIPQISTQPIHPNRAQEPFVSHRADGSQKIRSRQRPTYLLAAHCGEKAGGAVLGQQMKIVATDANETVLKNTGHWVLEEGPKETTDALLKVL